MTDFDHRQALIDAMPAKLRYNLQHPIHCLGSGPYVKTAMLFKYEWNDFESMKKIHQSVINCFSGKYHPFKYCFGNFFDVDKTTKYDYTKSKSLEIGVECDHYSHTVTLTVHAEPKHVGPDMERYDECMRMICTHTSPC